MIDTVSKVLFIVSSSVLVPVILALLFAAAWTVLLLGGFLRELGSRLVIRSRLSTTVDALLSEAENRPAIGKLLDLADSVPAVGFVPRYLRACWAAGPSTLAADKIVDEIEMEMARRVAGLSVLARLGPMLGLTGTLIPLGPGLVNLARGDVAGLANQLVIAFSTTVVGLLVGMLAFVCAQTRRGWYAKDLSDILFLEEIRPDRGHERGQPKP